MLWHFLFQVNKDEVSDEDENNRMKSAEREAAGSEAKQPKSAKEATSAQGVNKQQSDSALKPKKPASKAAPKQQANKRLSEDASSASSDKRKKQKTAKKLVQQVAHQVVVGGRKAQGLGLQGLLPRCDCTPSLDARLHTMLSGCIYANFLANCVTS